MTDQVLTPDVFTADYVGEPGERTFFLQTRGTEGTHTFLVEKGQVHALATRAGELLLMIDQADEVAGAEPARDPLLDLHQPAEAEWRVGTIALGYEEGSDVVVVSLESAIEAVEEDIAEPEPDEQVQILLGRPQVRAFVRHALAVIMEGRPLCQFCGLPIDPSGHICPASNGHHPGTTGEAE